LLEQPLLNHSLILSAIGLNRPKLIIFLVHLTLQSVGGGLYKLHKNKKIFPLFSEYFTVVENVSST